MARSRFTPLTGLAAALALLAAPALAQDAAPRVSVSAAYTRDVTESVTFIGRGEATDEIDVVARVSGFIEDVAAADGAEVSAGDLLFRVEREAYDASLAARQADESRAEANLELAGSSWSVRRHCSPAARALNPNAISPWPTNAWPKPI